MLQETTNRLIPHLQTAIRKLLEQGEKSLSVEEDWCAYRGKNVEGKELCCAIGFLINDEIYDRDIESQPAGHNQVQELVHKSLGFDSPFSSDELAQLEYLQTAHDNAPSYTTQFNDHFTANVCDLVERNKLPKECLEALKP